MARRTHIAQNPWTGQTTPVYEGFSWTTLFWGPLPPLFRGDGVGFLIGLGLVLASFVVPVIPFLVWGLFYNEFHAAQMAGKGWILHPTGAAWYGPGAPSYQARVATPAPQMSQTAGPPNPYPQTWS